jgi:hypothetical protein
MLPAAAWSLVGSPPEPRPEHIHQHQSRARRRAAAAQAELTIRRSGPADAPRLAALATLDSSRPLDGDALVAETDGVPIAALELRSGRAVADPFLPTAQAVGVLRLRAEQLRAPERAAARRRIRPLAAMAGLLR